MPIVPGYAYDAFLSYAHADNIPVRDRDNEYRWVDTFHQTVETETKRTFAAFNLWRDDEELEYHQSFDRQLTESVETSAILVVLMSEPYLNSDWCKKELQAFWESISRRQQGDPSVLVVCREFIDVQSPLVPAPLKSYKWFPFYTGDRDHSTPLGFPHPYVDPKGMNDFYVEARKLGRLIAKALTALRSQGQPGLGDGAAPPPIGPAADRPPPASAHRASAITPFTPPPLTPAAARKRVFLAETPDDLEVPRQQVRAYLERHAIILPEGKDYYYPTEAPAFRAAVERDLADADVFVQLLNGTAGKRRAGVPQGYPRLQFELATAVAAARGRTIEVLQWCGLAVDIGQVADEDMAMLLRQPTVRQESLTDFEAWAVTRLQPPPVTPPVTPPEDPHAVPMISVFVIRTEDAADRALAEKISEMLIAEEAAVSVTFPTLSTDAEATRLDLEENLRSCDGLIVVYGEPENVFWVRGQIGLYEKQVGKRAKGPVLALDVIQGPPPVDPLQKPPVNKVLRGLRTHYCSGDAAGEAQLKAAVGAFLERVRARPVARAS